MAIAKISHLLYTYSELLSINFTSLAKFIHGTSRQTLVSGRPAIIHYSALENPAPKFKWSRKKWTRFKREIHSVAKLEPDDEVCGTGWDYFTSRLRDMQGITENKS